MNRTLVRCCDFIEVGGYGDQLLDWLFGEIISYVKEHYLPGRVLTDRDNIAVIGNKFLCGWGNLDMPIYVAKISFFVKTLSL